jgi:hypothetical protein
MTSSSSSHYDRRNFLRGLAGASAAGVAATAITPIPAEAYDPGPDETKARYRETEHVKAFYRTNGYEGVKNK